MSKFFFCHSPFAVMPKGAAGFIYGYDKPRFFAIVTAFSDDNTFEDQNASGYRLLFQYNRGDGHDQFYIIQVMQNIDKASVNFPATLLKAAAWYWTFLNRDDQKKYGKKSTWSYLRDFSVLTKHLQILRMPTLKKYLVSYPNGLKTVQGEMALESFLTKALQYPAHIIEEGLINHM
jgi:hypothetical protein